MGNLYRNNNYCIKLINPGKAALAGWNPGDELIGTGKEFIGKY
jgi:hypothetical protein